MKLLYKLPSIKVWLLLFFVRQCINSAERERERKREREGQRILSLMLEIRGAIIFLGSKSVPGTAKSGGYLACARKEKGTDAILASLI